MSARMAISAESISAVTSEAATGASQAASAAEQLSQKAEQLQRLVGQFKVAATPRGGSSRAAVKAGR